MDSDSNDDHPWVIRPLCHWQTLFTRPLQMTHLGRALKRFMPYRSAARIADRIGISHSYLNRLCNGKRSGVSPGILKALANEICTSADDRAELIAAHLKDESCGYWPSLIEIKIVSGKQSGKSEKTLGSIKNRKDFSTTSK